VEWLFEDGKTWRHTMPDDKPIEELYAAFYKSRKRKRGFENMPKADEGLVKPPQKKQQTADGEAARADTTDQPEPASKDDKHDKHDEKIPIKPDPDAPPAVADIAHKPPPQDEPAKEARPQHLHFYLLKPQTPSHLPRVLIPLVAAGTLHSQLYNQVVLEYPTIAVLSQPVSTLKTEEGEKRKCITEDAYYALLRKDTDGLKRMEQEQPREPARSSSTALDGEEDEDGEGEEVDDERLKEVLARDLSTMNGGHH
jgi:hypothetical protein